jgi:hypothetical protein
LVVEKCRYKRAELTEGLVQQMGLKMDEQGLSFHAKQVIRECLRLNPAERGKANDILARLYRSYPALKD